MCRSCKMRMAAAKVEPPKTRRQEKNDGYDDVEEVVETGFVWLAGRDYACRV